MATESPTAIRKKLHSSLIAEVLADWPEAKTAGFMRAMRTLPDAEYVQSLAADEPKWFRAVGFVPDAWMIVPDKRHVVVFEIVHANDISADKFARMADMSWALDEDYYRLILIRCDRFGRRAYDVQTASLVSEVEHVTAGEPSQGWYVPDWQKYDVEYCQQVMDADEMEAAE